MEEQINGILQTEPVDLNEHIQKFHELLCDYEKKCYRNDKKPDNDLIESWMEHMKGKIRSQREKREIFNRREDAEDQNVFDTLKLLVSQVETADQNILLFENSNVKLTSLACNSKFLNDELLLVQNNIKKAREAEINEVKKIHIAFVVFIVVFCYIILSRLLILKMGLFVGKSIGRIFSSFNRVQERDDL